MRALTLACAVFAIAAGSSFALAASTLNFPRLALENDRYTGIAIVNPTAQDALVTLTAYGAAGERLSGPGFVNPVALTIKANQQTARLTSELFGGSLAAGTIAWLQATSTTDGLTGFFLFLDGSVTFLDGADLPALGQKLLFPQVRTGAGYSTEVDLVNPSAATANVQAQLVSAGSAPVAKFLTIPPRGTVRVDAAATFEVDEVAAAAY